MKTLILGGGVIGLTTAMVLQERGDDVEILEGREGVGLETSYGNGGLLTVDNCVPWNAPGIHKYLLQGLFGGDAMMKIHPKVLPSLVPWGLKFLRKSTGNYFWRACAGNFHLSKYAVQKLSDTMEELNLQIDCEFNGNLALYRDDETFTKTTAGLAAFDELGVTYQVLDRDATIAHEPHLKHIADKLSGAVLYPNGGRGDCFKFCQQLADTIVARGGKIRTGIQVSELRQEKHRAKAVVTDQGEFGADRIVVALGNHAAKFLRGAGIRVPIQPVKGHSITVPVEAELPKSPMIDASHHVGIVSLGNRIRLGGGAEFAGLDGVFHQHYLDRAYSMVEETLPHLMPHIKRDQEENWVGFRPVSADGLPFIGATRVDNLYVNVGHGQRGWNQSVGSAYLLADLIAGATPEIDPLPFQVQR